MQVSLFSSVRLTGFTVAIAIYSWNEMIMSIETMVGHSLHVLSDHLGDITGVHYKKNNSLLILLHLQVLHVLTLTYSTVG